MPARSHSPPPTGARTERELTKPTLDRYADVARTVDDDFLVAGRYESQKDAWPHVIADADVAVLPALVAGVYVFLLDP